jgi:hypothetical protein
LGFLVAVAMGISCMVAIVLLPAVLYLIQPRFVFGESAQAARTMEATHPLAPSSSPLREVK